MSNFYCDRETALLVNICNALALGLTQPWLPVTPKEPALPASPSKSPVRAPSAKKKGGPAPPAAAATAKVTISPDATPDLKKALEV